MKYMFGKRIFRFLAMFLAIVILASGNGMTVFAREIGEQVGEIIEILEVEESLGNTEENISDEDTNESDEESESYSESDDVEETESETESEETSEEELVEEQPVEPSEEVSDETSEESDWETSEDVSESNIIVAFEALPHEQSHIYLEEKIDITELISRMPKKLTVTLEDNRIAQIDVTWTCETYEHEIEGEYTFEPIWDEKYTLCSELVYCLDAPCVYVFIEEDVTEPYLPEAVSEIPNELMLSSDDENFEIYLANYYLEFESYIFECESPYRKYVEDLRADEDFQNSLVGWRVATFDLASEFEYSQKEYAYAQTILFDVLYEGEEFQNILGNAKNNYKRLNGSAWNKLCKNYKELNKNSPMTPELMSQLEQMEEFSDAMKVVGDLGNMIDTADSAYQVMEKLAKVQALMELPDEVTAILRDMKANAGNNPALQYALNEFAMICEGSLTYEQIALLFSSEAAFSEIAKELLGTIWKEVLKKCNGVGLSISTGQTMGKYASNILFSTDKTIETYYTLETLYEFENLLKNRAKSYVSAFKSNPSYSNARKMNQSVQMLYSVYNTGINYSIDLVECVYDEGIINVIYHAFNQDKYNDIMKSLKNIQKSYREFYDYSEEIAYSSYLDEYGNILGNDIEGTDLTTEEFVQSILAVEYETEKLSDFVVKKDTTLTEDVFCYGNLYVEGGTLNLNGHTMDIKGNAVIESKINLYNGTLKIGGSVLHSGGQIAFNKGTLYIFEDYKADNGTFDMSYEEDCLEVRGDFVYNSYHVELRAGSMIFGGDVIQQGTGYGLRCGESHKIILNGSGKQIVSSTRIDAYNELYIENDDVEIQENFTVKKLCTDGKIQSKNATIRSDIFGSVLDLNGKDLEIIGDIRIHGPINLNNGKLTVNGNVLHSFGNISFNKGELFAMGDYRMLDIGINSAGEEIYLTSSGIFTMAYEEDFMEVHGDYIGILASDFYLSAGSMIFKGDVIQKDTHSSKSGLRCIGSHKTIFNGTKKQTINSECTNSYNELYIENDDIVIEGYFAVNKLCTSARVQCKDTILFSTDYGSEFNLNGNDLNITGDITIDYNVNLSAGNLNVNGNVLHSDGAISFNKGTMHITENYRIQDLQQNSAGEMIYTSSWGGLVMNNEEDCLEVQGDFWIGTHFFSTFTEGTTIFGGDVIQQGTDYGLGCSGNHKTVFNGFEKQLISSTCTYSYNKLYIENETVEIEGYFAVQKLCTDAKIHSNNATIYTAYSRDALNLYGKNLEITGDIVIDDYIDLNSGKLTVNGNVLHLSGEIDFNKGTLYVAESYRIQSLRKNGAGEEEYTYSSGHLRMEYEEDCMEVRGDFICDFIGGGSLSNGTTVFGGDVIQLATYSLTSGLNCYENHRTIFNGETKQLISSSCTDAFNELYIENENIEIQGYFAVEKLCTDGKVKSNGAILYSDSYGNALNLNENDLEIIGDITIEGNVRLDQGYLTIVGDVLHAYGNIAFNNGTMDIKGDYRIQKIVLNSLDEEEYSQSQGYVKMVCEDDFLLVEGDFISDSNSAFNTFSAGTMRFDSNVDIRNSYFVCKGTHKTILGGQGKQIVKFSDEDNYFNILQLTQPLDNYEFTPNPCWIELITVEKPVEEVVINAESLVMEMGESYQLEAHVLPEDADEQTVMWESANSNIARVDENGLITAVSGGEAVITASAGSAKAYCTVTVNSYTVTFDSQGGTVIDPITNIGKGATITLPEEPEKEGYIFGGWYTKPNGEGERFTNQTKIDGNITVYAKWSEIPKLSLPTANYADGSVIEAGTAIILSTEEKDAKIYYTLDGTVPTVSSNLYKEAIIISTDTTIKAIAVMEGFKDSDVATFTYEIAEEEIIIYTVTFDSNGGSEVASQSVEEGSLAECPQAPVRDGYTFVGWFLNNELYDFATPIKSDITLIAQWTEMPTLTSPVANIESGSVVAMGTELTLSCELENAVIYYTTDGSDVTAESNVYSGPIVLNGDIIIKTFALCEGYKNSPVAEYSYRVIDENSEAGDVLPEDIPEGGISAIPKGLWIAGVDDTYEYSGNAIKPEVRVYDYKTLLEEKTDYTITYKNNTNAASADASKAPSILVKGKGNYAGSESKKFTIIAKSIEDEDVRVGDVSAKYNKKDNKGVPEVSWAGKKLKNKKDYVVSYPDTKEGAYVEPGIYTVQVSGTGNYSGTVNVNLTITENILLNKATVTKIANQTYTGEAIQPEVIVKNKGELLVKGVDYEVEYYDNVEIGTATASVKGIGRFGGEKKVTFKIVGYPMKKVKVSDLPTTMTYTGKPVEPKCVLKYTENGQTRILQENVNYTVSIENNVKVGTAVITFTGINDFSGTLKKKFKVRPCDIAGNSRISCVLEAQVPYEKGGSKPKPTVMFGDVVLEEGKDYTLSYKKNTVLSEGLSSDKLPVMTIKGKGNFAGTITKNYRIVKKELAAVEIDVPDKVYSTKKGAYKSVPTLTDNNGKKLAAKKDYEKAFVYTYAKETVTEDGTVRAAGEEVGANDILKVGTLVNVTITGKGLYTGIGVGQFRIVKADIKKCKAAIETQTYTGNPVTLSKDDIVVKNGKTQLSSEDFEIVGYENNVKKGTAKVIIRGVGDTYGGKKTIKFKIKAKGFKWWK